MQQSTVQMIRLSLSNVSGFMVNHLAYGIFILALNLLFCHEVLAQREPATPEKAFASAFQLYADGLYEQAIVEFEKFRNIYTEHPNVAEAVYYEAESSLAVGREDQAIHLLEFFHERYPTHPLAYHARVALGQYFYENQQHERAIEILAQVIEDYPPSEVGARSLYWMGQSALGLNRRDEAIRYFQRAADEYRFSSTAPLALYTVAYTYIEDEQLDRAARSLEVLSARYPNSPYARDVGLLVAEVYYELGDYAKAVEEIRRRINTLEGDEQARAIYLLAESYNQLGDSENAIVNYRRVIELGSLNPYYRPALFGLGWVYYLDNSYEWAAEQFAEASAGQNDNLAAKATYYEAVNRKLFNQPEQSIDLFVEFLERWPAHELAEAAQFELGMTYYQEGMWDLAEETLSAFAAAYPESEFLGEALYYRGNTFIALGEYEPALESFDRAIDLDAAPDTLRDEMIFQRAWLLYREGDYEAAAPEFLSLYENRQGKSTADALFWAAESHFQTGELNEAGRLFRTYLREYQGGKHTAAAQYALGWVHFKSGQYGDAAQYFERFLQSYRENGGNVPYRTDALLRLADSYYALKRFPEAVRTYSRVIEEGGDYALYQIGQSYANAGDAYEAISTFRRLLSEYPQSEWSQNAQYQLGYLYFLSQDYEQAVAQYNEIIDRWPRGPLAAKAQYAIGDAYFNEGRLEQAVEAYQRVLERYPQSPFVSDAASSIQYALVSMDDERRAEEIIDEFAEKNPGSPIIDELRFRQAEVKYQSGRIDEAVSDFQQFLRSSGNAALRAEAVYYLGVVSADRQQFEPAERYLTQLVNEYPRSNRRNDALQRLGNLYLEQNQYSEALRYFQLLEREQPRDKALVASARYGQSVALMNLNRQDEAERLLLEVTQNAPDAPESLPAFLGLARIYESNGRTVDAIRMYRQVVERSRDETGAEALFHLGSLLLEQGDARAALEEFSRIPVLYAGFPDWVAQSYLGQARAFGSLGQKGDAVRLYDRVVNEYAHTPFARIATREKAAL